MATGLYAHISLYIHIHIHIHVYFGILMGSTNRSSFVYEPVLALAFHLVKQMMRDIAMHNITHGTWACPISSSSKGEGWFGG